MEYHEAANIFPLDEKHIGELAKDIKKLGQQVPIELLDGKIIDGRRRYLACQKIKTTPKFRDVQVDDPIAYVLSLNKHRRHLTPSQLAMVAAKARKLYDQQAKERKAAGQKAGGRGHVKNLPENLPDSLESGDSRDLVGKALGVSGKSVDFATRILNQGTPELREAVEEGQLAVSTAARAASLTEAEQNALAQRAKSGQRRPRPSESDEPDQLQNGNGRVPKGVILANEAINCLTRIPKNDALRKRGFQLVTDWIRRNK